MSNHEYHNNHMTVSHDIMGTIIYIKTRLNQCTIHGDPHLFHLSSVTFDKGAL
jgi:hypothetical protein